MHYLYNLIFLISHPISTTIVATLFTWILYVLVMRLKRWTAPMSPAKQKILRIVLSPFIFIALLTDYFYKYIGSPMFLWTWPRPKEVMFTYVLTRVSKIKPTTFKQKYQKWMANKFCDLLDKSDPSGDHCKRRVSTGRK